MGVKMAPVLGPYRPTELMYCLSAFTPPSTLINPCHSPLAATDWDAAPEAALGAAQELDSCDVGWLLDVSAT